jgi:hydroxymethylpyrimidine/phosphomethylpyrimidine kinase
MGDARASAAGYYAKEPGELTQPSPSKPTPPPVALTIAGSDSSGGAGIQADLKTFTVHGVYGASVITALTAQNSQGVRGVHAVPAEFVALQLEAVLADLDVKAIKTGMLTSAETIESVTSILGDKAQGALVVDPVMVASSGDQLLEPAAISVMREQLMPLARLITPNLEEAAVLSGQPIAASRAEMEEQGRRLLDFGPQAVLVKGGHCGWDDAEAADVLVSSAGIEVYSAPRLDTPDTHGSGCSLSAAVAANLAIGHGLESAIGLAKKFVGVAIAGAVGRQVGHGRPPLDHLAGIDPRFRPDGDGNP